MRSNYVHLAAQTSKSRHANGQNTAGIPPYPGRDQRSASVMAQAFEKSQKKLLSESRALTRALDELRQPTHGPFSVNKNGITSSNRALLMLEVDAMRLEVKRAFPM